MKKIISIIIVLSLVFSVMPTFQIPVSAASVKYYQTAKASIPLRSEYGTGAAVKGYISTKGTSVKLIDTQKKMSGLLNFETWCKIIVASGTTNNGISGQYWVLRDTLTTHLHLKYEAGKCAAPGCDYEISVVYLNNTAKNMEVKVDNAPVRKAPYNDGEIVGRVKKGKLVSATNLIMNYKLSKWYKLADGNYIFTDNVKEATEKKVQTESNNVNSQNNNSGGAWEDLIVNFFKPSPSKNCIIHIYSMDKCINCLEPHRLDIKPVEGKTYRTLTDNVYEREKPYKSAKSTGKVYATKGSVIPVTGYAYNSALQKWYQTENGGWVQSVDNVTLKKAYFSTNSHVFTDFSETHTPKIVIEPSNAVITKKTWYTSDTNIVRVDDNGKITPYGVGTANVFCKLETDGGTETLLKYGITVTDLAKLDEWNYANDRFVKDLAVECSTYTSLSYPSYEVKNSESNEPLVYKKIKSRDDEPIEPETLKKLLNKRGFKYSVYNYVTKTQTTSPAVIASKLYKENNTPKQVVYVIIEGSAAMEGWQGNMKLTGASYNANAGNYHKTFLDAANDLKTRLDDYINTKKIDSPHVVITGHSRGAAVGNLLAEKLNKESSKYGKVYAYLFAPPNATKAPVLYNNIFNICNELDFVPYIPLSRGGWNYTKNGSVYAFEPQKSYKGEFKRIINSQFDLSVYDRTPDYSWAVSTPYEMSQYVGGKWPTVKDYYDKQVFGTVLLNPTYCGTAYSYFYDGLAAAAGGDLVGGGSRLLVHCTHTICDYKPLSCFVLGGALESVTDLTASFVDCHEMMTYHAAVLSGIYSEKTLTHLFSATTYGNGTVELNSDEQEALYSFFTQGENQLMLEQKGWDIEDTSTWSGIKWNTEGNIVSIDLSYMDLSGWFNANSFTKLKDLNLDGNQITMLAVADCTELESLNCMANQIGALSVNECSNLQELDCAFNKISSLDVSNMSQLVNLNCYGNEISSLNLNNATALEVVRCGNNELSTVDVSNNTSLNTFYCEGNNIIESQNAALLNSLNTINENGGSAIIGTQKYNSEYSFNENELSSLSTFANASLNLEKLGWDLEKPWTWQGVEWKIYGDEYHIASIDFGGMDLEGDLNLPEAEYVETVSCDNSSLTTLNLSGCVNLNSVNCYNSGISELTLDECSSLESINCDENYLEVEDVESSLNQIGLNTGIATYENQNIEADESEFNQSEREVLIDLLSTGDNAELLNWDWEWPGSWDGIVWTKADGEYRVNKIDFSGKPVCGDLDLTDFAYLEDFDFSGTLLESVTLPDCVTKIPETAFCNSGIKFIYMKDGITNIEESAFAHCQNLNTVVLPATVTRIYDNAFFGSENLKNIVFMGDEPLETGTDVFYGTSKEFMITYFDDTTWSDLGTLLNTYASVRSNTDYIVLLDENIELMPDDYYSETNNYGGDTVNAVVVAKAPRENVTCALSVNDESGMLSSITSKTINLNKYMNSISFEDVNIKYAGEEYCRLRAFVWKDYDNIQPIATVAERIVMKDTEE